MPEAEAAPVPLVTVAELEADPHGAFRRYRPRTPVILREGSGYLVLRAADVERLSRDPRMRQSETELPRRYGIEEGDLFDLFRLGMLNSNGAEHRRRRAPFTRAFAAAVVAAMRPAIRESAERLVEEWRGEPGVDLVERYASLIPARTISAILRLPEDDIPHFTRLVYSVSRVFSFTFTRADLPTIAADADELCAYVERLLGRRREQLGDDVLSSFLADADAKGEMSAAEIVIQVISLIIGGTDTTRVTMAALVSLLLQHRAQWDAVRADPSLARAAVAEALRYEPSVAHVGRVVLEDILLEEGAQGAVVLPAGQPVTLSLMSALRDPATYDRPDAFDIHRTNGRRLHPVFGGGAHRCLGEALAWTELEEGLSVLTTRLPGLHFASAPPEIRGHMGIRRIGAMPITW